VKEWVGVGEWGEWVCGCVGVWGATISLLPSANSIFSTPLLLLLLLHPTYYDYYCSYIPLLLAGCFPVPPLHAPTTGR
jgi:hypothetical protein